MDWNQLCAWARGVLHPTPAPLVYVAPVELWSVPWGP